MVDVLKDPQEFRIWATAMKRSRRVAWLVILIADAGLLVWGWETHLRINGLVGLQLRR